MTHLYELACRLSEEANALPDDFAAARSAMRSAAEALGSLRSEKGRPDPTEEQWRIWIAKGERNEVIEECAALCEDLVGDSSSEPFSADDFAGAIRALKNAAPQEEPTTRGLSALVATPPQSPAGAAPSARSAIANTDTVPVPRALAEFVRKVWLPANPNKLRSAHPDTVANAKAFIALVESPRSATREKP